MLSAKSYSSIVTFGKRRERAASFFDVFLVFFLEGGPPTAQFTSRVWLDTAHPESNHRCSEPMMVKTNKEDYFLPSSSISLRYCSCAFKIPRKRVPATTFIKSSPKYLGIASQVHPSLAIQAKETDWHQHPNQDRIVLVFLGLKSELYRCLPCHDR